MSDTHDDQAVRVVLAVFWCGMLFTYALHELDDGGLDRLWTAWYVFCAALALVLAVLVALGLSFKLEALEAWEATAALPDPATAV